MSINNLPRRLSVPARLLFQAAKDANVSAVLVGGAASIFHGCDRETKDLDIDVNDITAFAAKIPREYFDVRVDAKRSNRLSVTFKHESQAVSVDISSEKSNLWEYFKRDIVEDDSGIRLLSPRILLASKLKTYTERPEQAVEKRETDLHDIIFLEGKVGDLKQKVSGDLVKYIVTDEVLAKFWVQCPVGERGFHKAFLGEVGLKFGNAEET